MTTTASSASARSPRDTPSPAASPRVTKRRAETRARLMEAAFRVFADKGFGQVRIEDVCTAAGYTRGAFYSQFESLDELFFTLYDERARLIAAQVAESLTTDEADTPIDVLIERVAATLLLDRDWLLVKTDFLLHAARHPDVAERLALHRSALRLAVEQRLQSASERLSLPESNGDIPAAARAVIAAYDGVTVQLLLDGDITAARAWLTQLLGTLLDRGHNS
ncbi:TetR/AcrR family transcriptional regulator [Mycolicibacterium komossense]|uniref:TetR family transcriptional regulator n=1 Tax=Mycolicibacterium komossense TaxID=1779 RepID=A0ABT3CF70_9MYCO|nr:TetR family transcriptional regulator [Mycolicibacterium komossense]MCV7228082.1 TetR family transcriptional regulator [Mycolicibacterium komossense]